MTCLVSKLLCSAVVDELTFLQVEAALCWPPAIATTSILAQEAATGTASSRGTRHTTAATRTTSFLVATAWVPISASLHECTLPHGAPGK